MLINVKMPTIVGILTFISRINFVLSRVEHEKMRKKKFYNLGPGLGPVIMPAPGQNQLLFYTYEIACCRRVEAAKHVTCDLYFYTGGKPEGVES